MNYQPLFISAEHYYSVGIDHDSGDYLIEVVITWIAWYSIYFRLTEAEIAAFKSDPTALVELSYEMAADKGVRRFRDRMVLNQGPQSA
jgi:hypothetical protein